MKLTKQFLLEDVEKTRSLIQLQICCRWKGKNDDDFDGVKNIQILFDNGFITKDDLNQNNFKEFNNMPPISYAICFGQNIDVVKKLLELGADPNLTDSVDATPLYWASYYILKDIVKLLLNAGADPNVIILNNAGTTLQMVLKANLIKGWKNKYNEIIDLLKKHGAK